MNNIELIDLTCFDDQLEASIDREFESGPPDDYSHFVWDYLAVSGDLITTYEKLNIQTLFDTFGNEGDKIETLRSFDKLKNLVGVSEFLDLTDFLIMVLNDFNPNF